jgi:hypothetical protein
LADLMTFNKIEGACGAINLTTNQL